MMDNWDIVVAGAGPAGTLAARNAAALGWRVLLVDRAMFPRDKVCGGYLGAGTLALLQQQNLGELPYQLGGRPIQHFQLSGWNRRMILKLAGGISLTRRTWDAALVEAASRQGAQFFPGTEVRLGNGIPSGREVWLRNNEGSRIRICARMVLMANGIGTRTEIKSGSENQRIGVSAHLPPQLFLPPGVLSMAYGKQGYVGMSENEQGGLNLAAAINPVLLRRLGTAAAAVAAILREAGHEIPEGLEHAGWQGTPPLSFRRRCLFGENVIYLGDAAGYIEPFTGEGMGWALAAGALAAEWSDFYLKGRTTAMASWESFYRKRMDRLQKKCRRVTHVLHHPLLARSFFSFGRFFPDAAQEIVNRFQKEISVC